MATSKQTAATDTPATGKPAAPEYIPMIGQRPYMVQIIDAGNLAFDTAAVLISQGYRFAPDRSPEIFPHNGVASIWLTLGQSDVSAIDRAKGVMEHALSMQQFRYDQDVLDAAKRMIEQEKADALAAQRAKEIAAAQAKIRELQKQIEQ